MKAEYKGISYEAKAHTQLSAAKDQASDYYMTLFDPTKNQAYAMKVTSALQFTQVIEHFQEELRQAREGHEGAVDNEAIKKMTYMEKKK